MEALRPLAACSLLLSRVLLSLLARPLHQRDPHSATPPCRGGLLHPSGGRTTRAGQCPTVTSSPWVRRGGTVRMYNYDQDVEQSLSNACLEVVQEDPSGSHYSVDFIRYDVTPIVSYYEAAVSHPYAAPGSRSPPSWPPPVPPPSAPQHLLTSFGTEVSPLRISYLRGGRDPHPNPSSGRPTMPVQTPPWICPRPRSISIPLRGGERPPAHRGGPAPPPPGQKSSSAAGPPWPGAPMRSWSPHLGTKRGGRGHPDRICRSALDADGL